MAIDVLFLLFMALAVFKGIRQGLIIAVCSTLAIVIGLAAAIKLSATVAVYLKESMHVTTRWLPVLAFLLVFICVVLLVRWGARLMEAAVELAMLSWLNKLGGILLYAVAYTIILSVLLFYAVQVHGIPADTLSSSKVYPFIRSWGPWVMDEFGKFVPFFRGMFVQLEDFFGGLKNKL